MQHLNPQETRSQWDQAYGGSVGETDKQKLSLPTYPYSGEKQEAWADLLAHMITQEVLPGKAAFRQPRLLLALFSLCAVVCLFGLLILIVLVEGNGGYLGVVGFAFLLACAAIAIVNVSFNQASTALLSHLPGKRAGARPREAGMAAIESIPTPPVAGESVTITYQGHLAITAKRITMHWGYSNFQDVFMTHWGQTYWNGVTDTPMIRQDNGSWKVTVTVPFDANALNMAFYNQNHIWDNNNSSNYHLPVVHGSGL